MWIWHCVVLSTVYLNVLLAPGSSGLHTRPCVTGAVPYSLGQANATCTDNGLHAIVMVLTLQSVQSEDQKCLLCQHPAVHIYFQLQDAQKRAAGAGAFPGLSPAHRSVDNKCSGATWQALVDALLQYRLSSTAA